MRMEQLLAISRFLENHMEDALPIKVAYKFNKLISLMKNDITFYNDRYKSLIEQYTDPIPEQEIVDGNNRKIKQDQQDEFSDEITKLWNLEVETPNIVFSIDELSSLKGVSVAELQPFMDLIKE